MSNFAARLTLGFILVGAAVAVRLAFWQLDRHHERKASNELLLAARGSSARPRRR
jgi:cytochrome oxidase assembly protein ShyY1